MSVQTVGNTVYVLTGDILVKAPLASADPASNSVSISQDLLKDSKHVLWGQNDDFPLQLKRDLCADTVLKPGIRLKSEMYYAGGLTYGRRVLNDKNNIDWQYVINSEIDAWLENSFIEKQYYQIFYDLVNLQISFPQFVLSLDGKRIARMTSEFTMASHCRFGRIGKHGYPEFVYLNADFGTSEWKQENNVPIPCAPEYDTISWIKKNIKPGGSFIIPIKVTDGWNQYYPEVDWNTARNAQWVQISKDVAVFNKQLINNKLTILYHVETHPDFWPATFGVDAWNDADDAAKVEMIKRWAKAFADTLKGAQNVGNVLTSDMGSAHGQPEKTFSLLKITKVDREIDFKEGAYLPTSKEASEHKVFALGLHSDITGVTPGGGMGAGSGSNNRVAFNQRAMLAKAVQDMAARPMTIVRDFNGWPSDIKFVFEMSLITTLDQGAETAKQTPN